MNHKRNLCRFTVVVFWLLIVGATYTAVRYSGNVLALSWFTLLVYGVVFCATIYAGIFITKPLWSIK